MPYVVGGQPRPTTCLIVTRVPRRGAGQPQLCWPVVDLAQEFARRLRCMRPSPRQSDVHRGGEKGVAQTVGEEVGVGQPFLSQIRAGKRPMAEALRVKVEALGA
jgi:hypothetical protein